MGYQSTKYIGIPLEEKSRTTLYRDSWGVNANSNTYKSSDVVMVTGNRASTALGQALLARHFRRQYVPLLDAAVQAKATILFGADAGIDPMVKQHLSQLGYDFHLNSVGFYEARSQAPKLEVFGLSPKLEPVVEEQEEEEEEAEMMM